MILWWDTAPGPNAFVNCYASNAHGDSGPLESWASGVLFDNVRIEGGELWLVNRWTQPPGAGWSAANCVLWQCQAAVIRAFRPPTANNWVLGYWAEAQGDASFSGQSDFIRPLSLYQAQLADRLGTSRGEAVGPLLLDPIGSTSPTVEQAAGFVASSSKPPMMLRDLIEQRMVDAVSEEPAGVLSLEQAVPDLPVILSGPASSRPIKLQNGWLTIEGRVLTGGHLNPTWWRGTIRPADAVAFGPSISRFAPGRYGLGLTDELEETARRMFDQRQVVYDHHYGLWFDRRRDDHLMVRRADGNVAPPFFEQPFARTGRGTAWDGLSQYDLTQFNPWYWGRLTRFAQLCDQRGLLLLHQHYFQHNMLEAGAHWADCPWRPANNVNAPGFPEPPPYVGDKRIFLAHQFYDTSRRRIGELHAGYVRQCLESVANRTNVIHSIGAEYTGPLAFAQFWLDAVRRWQIETQHDALVALACTKDVQDAVLADPKRSETVDVIDIRYWCYGRDGKPYAPAGGVNMAPRQHMRQMNPEPADVASIARAVREYRLALSREGCDLLCRQVLPQPQRWVGDLNGRRIAGRRALPARRARASDSKDAPVDSDDPHVLRLAASEGHYLLYAVDMERVFDVTLPTPEAEYRLTWIDPPVGRMTEEASHLGGIVRLTPKARVLWIRPVDD